MRQTLALFLIVISSAAATSFSQSRLNSEIQKWREAHEKELTADNGWLTVAGLFWLKPGQNTVGTGKDQSIVLPEGSAPATLGTLELANDIVTLKVAADETVSVEGKAVREYQMTFEKAKPPAPFLVGSLVLSVIKRGERYGLRVRDKNSRARQEFKGLKWFPVNSSYRVTADFLAYEKPKEITIMNVLGDELKLTTPGLLTFRLKGQKFQLRPVIEDDKLFIIFRDRTAGKTTYGAGRYLYAAMPKEGKVVLDFNRAENPPCAFTKYATCPLPPSQNRLPIAIPAGELAFHLKE